MLQEEPASLSCHSSVTGRDVLCFLLLVVVAGGAVVADVLTKRWALLHGSEGRVLVHGLLAFSLATNTGASFGLFLGRAAWLAVVSAIILAGVLIFWWCEGRRSLFLSAAVGLLAGGALGNLRDRVHLGWVIDFLRFDFRFLRWWPAFNVADVAAVIGVVMIVLWLVVPHHLRGRE